MFGVLAGILSQLPLHLVGGLSEMAEKGLLLRDGPQFWGRKKRITGSLSRTPS